MTDANKALAHRWFEEVWNQGNANAIDELFAADGKSHGFPEPDSVLTGPPGFRAAHKAFHDAFSNIRVHLDDLVAECDRVAIRFTATVTHSGDGLGFPATGRTVTFSGACFVCVHEGLITEGWNFIDFAQVTRNLQAL